MLISVVVVIAGSGWKMTKGLGYAMFGLYGVFVIVEIARVTRNNSPLYSVIVRPI